MGKLQVCVCAARNLYDNQVISLPDPYCRVRLGDKHYNTKVVNNSLNPVWNETFRFQVADENTTQVCIELWNKNIISDDIMGTYVLSLSGLSKGIVRDEWFLLSHSKTNAEVHIRLLACDFGNDPRPEDRWRMTTDINNDPALKPGARPPPPNAAPSTVGENKNNTPMVSNLGPAVIPSAAAPPPSAQSPFYPPPQQPVYSYPPQQPAYPPPPQQAPQGYSYPPSQQPGYSYPPQQSAYPPPPQQAPQGYSYPPSQQPGYSYPPQQPAYPPPPQQAPQGYSYPPPPPQQGYYPPAGQQPQGYPQYVTGPRDPNYRY